MRKITPATILHNVDTTIISVNGNLYCNAGVIEGGNVRPFTGNIPKLSENDEPFSLIDTETKKGEYYQYTAPAFLSDNGNSADCFRTFNGTNYWKGYQSGGNGQVSSILHSTMPNVFTSNEGKKITRLCKGFADVTDPEDIKILEQGVVSHNAGTAPATQAFGAGQYTDGSIIFGETDSSYKLLSYDKASVASILNNHHIIDVTKDFQLRNSIVGAYEGGTVGASQFLCEVDGVSFFNTIVYGGTPAGAYTRYSPTTEQVSSAHGKTANVVRMSDEADSGEYTWRSNKLTVLSETGEQNTIQSTGNVDLYPFNIPIANHTYISGGNTIVTQYRQKSINHTYAVDVSDEFVDVYMSVVRMSLTDAPLIDHIRFERFRYDRNTGTTTLTEIKTDDGTDNEVALDLAHYNASTERLASMPNLQPNIDARQTSFQNLTLLNEDGNGNKYLSFVSIPIVEFNATEGYDQIKNSVIATFKLNGDAIEYVGGQSFGGCFGGENVSTGYVKTTDNNMIAVAEQNGIHLIKWDASNKQFVKTAYVDVEPLSMYLSENKDLYILDYNHDLRVIGEQNDQIVRIEFAGEVPNYDGTNTQEITLNVSVSNTEGDFLPANVSLTIDGNCSFQQNGEQDLTLLTTDVSVSTVTLMLTGYGQINVTPTNVELV